MMKMDGRGSSEYQIWEKRDIIVSLEDKTQIVSSFTYEKGREKRVGEGKI